MRGLGPQPGARRLDSLGPGDGDGEAGGRTGTSVFCESSLYLSNVARVVYRTLYRYNEDVVLEP